MTKALAIELAPLRIRVKSAHPGFVDTDMARKLVERVTEMLGGANGARPEMIVGTQPIGAGEPRDAAKGVVFLVSDRASFMTGSELIVDGGAMA